MRVFTAMLVLLTLFVFVVTPLYVFAAPGDGPGRTDEGGFIPCGYSTDEDRTVGREEQCRFEHLVKLAQNIVTWLLWASVFVAAIAFTWGGFVYLTSAGDTGKVSQAHAIFKNVAIGFVLALSAWLIVYTITNTLLEEEVQDNTILLDPS